MKNKIFAHTVCLLGCIGIFISSNQLPEPHRTIISLALGSFALFIVVHAVTTIGKKTENKDR